jgi:hypothetical protein
MIQKL